MTTYISLLRGINVGGHRLMKMDALKNICTHLDFTHVQTYLQSGNLVFQSTLTNTAEISSALKESIEKEFGFDVPILTMHHPYFEDLVNNNPFLKDDSKDASFFHITFLSNKVAEQQTELLKEADLNNDAYMVSDQAVYLYCPNGYSTSKLTNSLIERKLGVEATTRNWKTIQALLVLAK